MAKRAGHPRSLQFAEVATHLPQIGPCMAGCGNAGLGNYVWLESGAGSSASPRPAWRMDEDVQCTGNNSLHSLNNFHMSRAVQAAYEIDGDTYSCSGGDAAFDMFVQFVIEDYDTSVASRVCEKAAAMRVRQPGDRQRLPLHAGAAIHHDGLLKIIEQMERTLDEPVPLEDMAALSCLSRRQVERIFSKQIGRSPARYYLEMRLERAHLLIVNSQLPIVEIAMACGFVSASHFSKAYREKYEMTPSEARSEAIERRRSVPAARPVHVAQEGYAAGHLRKHAQSA